MSSRKTWLTLFIVTFCLAALPSAARAGACIPPVTCLCSNVFASGDPAGPSHWPAAVSGQVSALSDNGATLRVQIIMLCGDEVGVAVGDSLAISDSSGNVRLEVGDRIVVGVKDASSIGEPQILDNNDQAICSLQRSVRVPRDLALAAIIADAEACRQTMLDHGLDEDASCDAIEGCAVGSSPTAAGAIALMLMLMVGSAQRRRARRSK